MQDVYILGCVRTAVGTFGGTLKDVGAVTLGSVVLGEACKRAGVDARLVDYVLMGNVLQAGLGQNPARQAALIAGIPKETPAMTINKVCGSGLNAVNLAAALIQSGQAECVAAGGMENMSRAPHTLQLRWGQKMGNVQAADSMIHEGLWDAFYDYHMGITAENVAAQYGVTREMQDAFALQSQKKALRARKEGRFQDEIAIVEVPQKKGGVLRFAEDEHIRDTSMQALMGLRPAFLDGGTVTAGNSSGINDGAAAMLVVSGRFLKKHGCRAQAKWLGAASCGVDPAVMGTGPIPSVKKALGDAGLTIEEMDLVEANEAFASQAIAVMQGIGAREERVNVNGGAIALGHPIGASGARIAVTLLHELQKRDGRYGLATLCIGGGMGEATIFERDGFCR